MKMLKFLIIATNSIFFSVIDTCIYKYNVFELSNWLQKEKEVPTNGGEKLTASKEAWGPSNKKVPEKLHPEKEQLPVQLPPEQERARLDQWENTGTSQVCSSVIYIVTVDILILKLKRKLYCI
jgi:hypothetical protein